MVVVAVGVELPDPVFEMISDGAAVGPFTTSLVQGGEIAAWHHADFSLIRRSLQGF